MGGDGASQLPSGEHCCEQDQRGVCGAAVCMAVRARLCVHSERGGDRPGGVKGRVERAGAMVCLGGSKALFVL